MNSRTVAASPDLPNERLHAELFAGNKIAAIKLHREATGSGLAEAKQHVEKLEAELRAQQPEKFVKPAGKSGCVSVLALTAAAVVVWNYLR
ncbi:MAG: ribosomal protein L7/L12 [Verrucomicrobia bacterium]|nr:ribosomal protein L7/L12 [Verrucomicrobiota bacterium]